MGQPPANVLAHPVPVDGYGPSGIPAPAANRSPLLPALNGARAAAPPAGPAAIAPARP
jgi:hypothetical protein